MRQLYVGTQLHIAGSAPPLGRADPRTHQRPPLTSQGAILFAGTLAFASSTVSSRLAASCEHTVAFQYLLTFSGQSSPTGRYHIVLLALHSLQVEQPHVYMKPSGYSKQHTAIPTGFIPDRRGPLYTHYGNFLILVPGVVSGDTVQGPAGWLENLDGAPACCADARETNCGITGSSGLRLLRSQRMLLLPQPSLSCFSLAHAAFSCLIGSALNVGVHYRWCWGGGQGHTSILNLPSELYILKG